MNPQQATTVDEWKQLNADRLIDCRWGGKITREACSSYQLRRSRYVLHFNGDRDPLSRLNADYLRCFFPSPCPHFLTDDEVELRLWESDDDEPDRHAERRSKVNSARELHRLTSPDEMLAEGSWARSLIKP